VSEEEYYTPDQLAYLELTEDIEAHLTSVISYLQASAPSDRRKAAEHLRQANELFKGIDVEEDLPDV
jgi:hypothetical protein